MSVFSSGAALGLLAIACVGSAVGGATLCAGRRKRRELARLLHRSEALIDAAPNAVQFRDLHGRILTSNRAARMAFGINESSPEPRDFAEMWPQSVRETIRTAIATTLNGTPSRFDADYDHPEGRRVAFSVVASPVANEKGVIEGFVAISADVTARRRNEQALIAAKNGAEEAMKARTDFLSAMGNEIRPPLCSVIELLDSLRRMPQPPAQRRHTEAAIARASSISDTLEHILDAAALDTGNWEPASAAFNPASEIARAVDTIRSTEDPDASRLQTELSPDLHARVVGDAVRLRRILAQLLHICLPQPGERAAILEAVSEARPGGNRLVCIQISTTKTGIQIPDLASRVVSQLGGELECEAEAAGGTRLTLRSTFPRADTGDLTAHPPPSAAVEAFVPTPAFAPAAVPVPSAPPAETGHAPSPARSPAANGALRILCAEDDPTNRTVLELMLSDTNSYALHFVENGRQAVDCLKTERFDLVLMDNRMPVMDGFEATRLIRSPATGTLDPAVPIIALTANASKAYRDQCFSSGMNEYLTKPLRAVELRAAIARLAKRDAQAAGPQPAPPMSAETSTSDQAPRAMSEEELLALLDEADQSPAAAEPAVQLSEEARAKITRQYLADTPLLLNQMRLALVTRDAVTLGRSGHSLKSSSRYVNAARLSEIGKSIEFLADAGDFAAVSPLIAETDHEFEHLRERLHG